MHNAIEQRRQHIEDGVLGRLMRRESVRFGSTVIDDDTVINKMHDLDPDRYATSIYAIACGTNVDSEVGVEGLRRLFEQAVSRIIESHQTDIYDQAKREVQHG